MIKLKILCVLFIGTFDAEATVLTCNRIDRKERDSFGCLVANQELLDDSTVTFNTSVNSAGFNFDDDKNDMKIFDVVDTKLTRLPNEIFNTFISIKAMQLENTGIETWKREYLEGANVLYLLEIIRSSITYFPSDAFAEAPELSVLAIINSKMNSINPDMFANLPKLESLGLCEHDFSGGLPTDAFASLAKSLKYLDLQATSLTRIPEGMFKKLGELLKLVLLKNKLPSVIDVSKGFPDKLRKIYVDKYITVIGAPERLVIKNTSPDPNGDERDS